MIERKSVNAVGNSQETIRYKQQVVNTLLGNEYIVKALNARDLNGELITEPEDLLYNYIFPYEHYPTPIDSQKCFITVGVDIENGQSDDSYMNDIILKIKICCHDGCMRMTEGEALGSTGATRIDLISAEIDKLFNKKSGLGVGMTLMHNEEGPISEEFQCRNIAFFTSDVKVSPCMKNAYR